MNFGLWYNRPTENCKDINGVKITWSRPDDGWSFGRKTTNNKEESMLVCMDVSMSNVMIPVYTDDEHSSINHNYVYFSASRTCCKYLNSVKNEDIFLIIKGFCPTYLIRKLHNIKCVHSIFLYQQPEDNKNKDRLIESCPKIVGIYTDKHVMKTDIINVIARSRQRSFSFNTCLSEIKAYFYLTATDLSFMISQVTKLHLSSYINDKKYSTKQLLHFCREYYCENKVELQRIDEFEKSLVASDDTLVQWYVENTFVQRLLKKAFANNDFEVLIPFQAYIVDLRNYIKNKFETSDEYKKGENVIFSFTTRLSHDQLNQLKQNTKQLLALKGFLLCNRSTQKAVAAAWNDRKNSDKTFSAVFLLKVDNRMGATKYCNVSDDSVLLDMSSVFIIDGVNSLGLTEFDTAYGVQLTATNVGEKLAREYYDSQKEICGDSFEICHVLLSNMHEKYGTDYFEHLLVTDSGGTMEDLLVARAYTYTKTNPDVAILLFDEAVRIQYLHQPPKKRDFVCTSKMLGDCYLASGATLTAMAIFKATLSYSQENQLDNYLVQSHLVCRIGQCYEKIGRFDIALMQYETACVLDAKVQKQEYSTRPGFLLSIGRIFSHQERYDLAYKIYIDALNAYRKVVPETHHYVHLSQQLAAEAAVKNGDLEAFREVASILLKSNDNEPSTMCSIQ